jgi:multiple sugar transport system ATP-binding protein
MSEVLIRDLDIRLGGNAIIEKLDLAVNPGEFLVLLGPSGCGKSTLLHSIAGLIDVSGGRMEIAGQDVTWADPKDRGIGMVFQSYALYPTMSVERNLSFGPRISGVDKGEIDRRVAKAAQMLHLTELLQRKPSQLSGGQRQRVAIGRALVRQADVLLFDEPLSNLDAKLRSELRRDLKQLHKDLGATMIYVTHDQVEAMTLATRIAVMRSGKIQQIDVPGEVYGRPANVFVAGFLGSPSMNFVKGALDVGGTQRSFQSTALTLDLAAYPLASAPRNGQAVLLGVRPEHIGLVAPGTPLSVTARVTLVEPMGAHHVVWVDVHGQLMGVHTDSRQPPPPDSVVGLTVEAGRVSVFDASSELRL